MATSNIRQLLPFESEIISSATGTLRALKYGRLCTLTLRNGTTQTSEFTLATLPEKYFPAENCSFVGVAGIGGTVHYTIDVNIAGKVTMNKAESVINYADFVITYITQN